MVKVQLFSGSRFNNGCYMSHFASLTAQNNYFNSLSKLSYEDVKISKLDEPILIPESLDTLFNYDYGRIQFNSYWYYFSVRKLEIERDNKTWVYYDIDPWETFRYQGKLSLGKGHITRSTHLNNNLFKFRPFAVNDWQMSGLYDITDSGACLFAWVHDDPNNKDWIYCFEVTSAYTEWLGSWVFDLLTTPIDKNDVLGCWFSPFVFNYPDAFTPTRWVDVATIDNNLVCKKINAIHLDYDIHLGYFHKYKTITFNNDSNYKSIITDCYGNIVYTENRANFSSTQMLHINLNITPQSCNFSGWISGSSSFATSVIDPSLTFTISCVPVDIFNDAFIEYQSQIRPFAEAQKKTQNEQQAVNGLANIGTSALAGAVAGSIVPGLGTGLGAIAGAVIGAAGVGLSYGSGEVFNKEYQSIESNQALYLYDTLKLNGSNLSEIKNGRNDPAVIVLTPDSMSLANYTKEVATFGYYYDLEDSLENWVITDTVLVANGEVEGIPEVYKSNIISRLNRGVTFKVS